tara:strand:- start:1500 stop:2555 length:1056 start_codon:yes stop_codon:yes gene_type:complete
MSTHATNTMTSFYHSKACDWITQNLIPHHQQTVLVTGATSGLGYATAWGLGLAKTPKIILGCRNLARGEQAIQTLTRDHSHSQYILAPLDLSSCLSLTESFEQNELNHYGIDTVIHNAGITSPNEPNLRFNEDGIDSCFFTNHIAPFYITQKLWPTLANGNHQKTIVSVTSLAAYKCKHPVNFKPFEIPFNPLFKQQFIDSYALSKLANLLFMYQLQIQARQKQLPITCIAAHPGLTITPINQACLGSSMLNHIRRGAWSYAIMSLAHTLKQCQPDHLYGALPQLSAALNPRYTSGYCRPHSLLGTHGLPRFMSWPRHARQTELAASLWQSSTTILAPHLESTLHSYSTKD